MLGDADGDEVSSIEELPLTDGVSEPVEDIVDDTRLVEEIEALLLMENVIRLEDDIVEDTEPDEASEKDEESLAEAQDDELTALEELTLTDGVKIPVEDKVVDTEAELEVKVVEETEILATGLNEIEDEIDATGVTETDLDALAELDDE